MHLDWSYRNDAKKRVRVPSELRTLIRRLLPHEVSQVIGLGKAMVEEIGGIPGGFNAAVFESTWSALLQVGLGIILVSQEKDESFSSAIGGVIGPDLNNGMLCFSETFFFSGTNNGWNGIKLIKELENTLKEIGVKLIYMNSLHNDKATDRVGRLYELKGYRKYGYSYTKSL